MFSIRSLKMAQITLKSIFKKQYDLEASIGVGVGTENIAQWYGALTAAILEIGEALAEDTRWKRIINCNTKKPIINRDNVIEETADAFIYLINSCIFYNVDANEILKAISEKQDKNIRRLQNV